MKKSAEMAYASERINSPKRTLLACTVLSAAVDIMIIVMLALGGVGGQYIACPIILLIFDAVYFAVSLFFTNFRFKYSLAVWISYAALFAFGLGIGAALVFGNRGTVITGGAAALWMCVHALAIVCSVISALYASRIIKNKWVAVAAAALFAGLCAGYGAYMVNYGFFGQGTGARTLVYTYDYDNASYVVDDVLGGTSTRVEVPETFNGKPVSAVRAGVFAESGVKQYKISGNVGVTSFSDVKYRDESDFAGKTIYAGKATVNGLRAALFNEASVGETRGKFLALANSVIPDGLDEGEGYVTFVYGAEAYEACGGKVLPAYIGRLSEFDLNTHASGFGYVAHREDGSVANYDWAFNNGGYIFASLSVDGAPVNGFTKSAAAEVNFKKVYRLYTHRGNDTKYDNVEENRAHCNDLLNGNYLGFKYLTEDGAETFMSGYKARKGFDTVWRYSAGSGAPTAGGNAFTYLSDTLKSITGNTLSIAPVYTINAPTLTANSDAAGGAITYGDSITLSGEGKAEAEGVTIEYKWYEAWDDRTAGTQKSLTLTPGEVGDMSYRLTATIDGGDVTSLTASAVAYVNFTVNRKQLTFNWRLPQEPIVYDGGEQGVELTYDNSQIINSDDVSWQVAGGAERVGDKGESSLTVYFKNAASYNMRVNLTGSDAAKYYAEGGNATVAVLRREAQVDWTGYEGLVYTGRLQCPSATAQGVAADGALNLTVTGGRINAGEGAAVATCRNTNYTLKNNGRPFTVAKAPLTVTPAEQTVTYGKAVSISAVTSGVTYSGFVSGEDKRDLSGSLTVTVTPDLNSGASYKAGVYEKGISIGGLSSENYDITFDTARLTINQLKATFSWNRSVSNTTYNGEEQYVTATVSNAVGGDALTVALSNDRFTDAGNYTARVENVTGERAENYIFENEEHPWEIRKRTLSISWLGNNTGNMYTYNGKEQGVSPVVTGLLPADESGYTAKNLTAVDCGVYTAEITLSANIIKNYDYAAIRLTCEYRITAAPFSMHMEHDGVVIVDSASGLTRQVDCYAGCTVTWQTEAQIKVTVTPEGQEAQDFIGESSYSFTEAGTYTLVIKADDKNYTDGLFTVKFVIREISGGEPHETLQGGLE